MRQPAVIRQWYVFVSYSPTVVSTFILRINETKLISLYIDSIQHDNISFDQYITIIYWSNDMLSCWILSVYNDISFVSFILKISTSVYFGGNRARKSRVYIAWCYEIWGIFMSLCTVNAQPRFRSHVNAGFKSVTNN